MARETSLLAGGCVCGAIRYRLTRPPMFVQCCHCTDCQTASGSAFALNAMIETDAVTPIAGAPEPVIEPTASGGGQTVLRCAVCRIAVWSHYAAAGPGVAFVRVGALDDPAACPPDIHLFTRSKLSWVALPEGVRAATEYYDIRTIWPADAFARLKAAKNAWATERGAAAATGRSSGVQESPAS